MSKEDSIKKIPATLPALGTCNVPFYKESSEILNFLGDKELKRLSKVAHLGTAATVFTGMNHSRLEYMLLQCAIINLLPKFNLGVEQFAISGKVNLADRGCQVSSGEELLKCWSILSNMGHAQYTYGAERSLLTYVRSSKEFENLILSIISQPDLIEWSKKVISEYKDSDFHWVISIIRLRQKGFSKEQNVDPFIQYLINFLLPLDTLKFQSYADRYKMYRLREIFEKVRLLSLVTLDSYYSHQPVRYQVSTAIMDLKNLFLDRETGFEDLLRQTAGWLADELYMHPYATATLRFYEMQASEKINKNRSKWFKSEAEFNHFMPNFMQAGFGEPSNDHLRVFLRIKLKEKQSKIFDNKDMLYIRRLLEKKISQPRRTKVSVLKNPFSKALYIDLLYDRHEANLNDIGQLCCGFYIWFMHAVKAQVDSSVKELFLKSESELDDLSQDPDLSNFFKDLKRESLRQDMNELHEVFTQIIQSIVRYLIPEELSDIISEFIPSLESNSPCLTRFNFNDGTVFDNVKENLKQAITSNPKQLHQDRIQELKTILHVARYSRAPLLIVCTEKFILRDSKGQDQIEWDGIILEISEKHVCLNIIEAKNKSTYHQNEQEAFKQLLRNEEILHLKGNVSTKRVIIPRLGAKLKINLC